MSVGGPDDQERFRLWLQASEALLSANLSADKVWERCTAFFELWSKLASGFGADPSSADPFDPAGWMTVGLRDGMGDFRRWIEQPELGGLFGDRFGDLLGGDSNVLRDSAEWIAWSTAAERLRSVTAEAWLRAFRRFLDRLSARHSQPDAPPPPTWQEMHALWIDVADREFAETQSSPDFLTAQQEMLRSQIALKERLRRRMEPLAELLGLPTRSEIDDLHRTVHELRREVRTLRRARMAETDGGRPG